MYLLENPVLQRELLVNLRMSLGEAGAIFVLFITQFVLSGTISTHFHDEVLLATSAIYLALAGWLLWRNRQDMRHLLRDGFRTPYAELVDLEFDTHP